MWVLYALGASAAIAASDLFRKLGSNLNDPFLNNLIFQIGSVSMAISLWLLFSRKFEPNTRGIAYALAGGMLVSIFTALFFKALANGPGISVVAPFVRVGGIVLVVIFGVLLFREKITWGMGAGIVLALSGVYLIFSGK